MRSVRMKLDMVEITWRDRFNFNIYATFYIANKKEIQVWKVRQAASVFKSEVCAGFDVTAVCKVLTQAGCLDPGLESGKTRYAVKRRIQGEGPRRVYVVSAKVWEA